MPAKNNAPTDTVPPTSSSAIVTDWILLRGLGREAGHWGEFKSLFEVSIPGARVHCLDLPGTGKFAGMRSFISIQDITDFVREKMQEEERYLRAQRQPAMRHVHLVAVSLGGMVAADWMERYADDFVTCTVINTSFRGVSPIYKRLLPPAYRHLLGAFKDADALGRERHVLRMISNRPENYEATARAWAQIAEQRPMTRENFVRQLLAAARFSPGLKHPPCPVLVLNSLRDRMVSPSCSEEIASRWNAELRQHPTAGARSPAG